MFIPNDFQFQNPFITVSPGLINLALPNGKYRHPIIGDGNCLFRSICFALSGQQDHYSAYRKNAVDYILNHSDDFKDDIWMMHKTSVSAYAQEMFQDRIYGESIMVIALCLSLEISITVYQKDSKKLETCEYIPTFNYQQHVEIFLDLNRKHYECILPTASHDLHFSSSSSAQTVFPEKNSTMTSAASYTVNKNNVFQSTFKSASNFNPEFKAIASSSTAKLLKAKTSGAFVAKKTYKKCPHAKIKVNCSACAPHRFCEHRKQKAQCKLCEGTQICDHGKNKQSCKHCTDRCGHGKFKAKCILCGGSGVCEHGKQKANCKLCGGIGICEHGKQKQSCKHCVDRCEHGKFKFACVECGDCLCEHGKHNLKCREWGISRS